MLGRILESDVAARRLSPRSRCRLRFYLRGLGLIASAGSSTRLPAGDRLVRAPPSSGRGLAPSARHVGVCPLRSAGIRLRMMSAAHPARARTRPQRYGGRDRMMGSILCTAAPLTPRGNTVRRQWTRPADAYVKAAGRVLQLLGRPGACSSAARRGRRLSTPFCMSGASRSAWLCSTTSVDFAKRSRRRSRLVGTLADHDVRAAAHAGSTATAADAG